MSSEVPILPFVFSTSGYNSPDIDFSKPIDPPIAAVICRASLGTPEWMGSVTNATDQSFPHYWPQWDRLRMLRGAYCYFYNRLSGADQARWFVNRVMAAGGFHPCDDAVIDVEDRGDVSIKEVLNFFTTVLALVPFLTVENLIIYSRRDKMDPLVAHFAQLTQAQRDFIKKIRIWPAGYPDDPSTWTFEQLAQNYRYNQDAYGPAVMVQYKASATVPGLSMSGALSVECNAIDPAYLAEWQKRNADFYGAPLPPADVITVPWSGVKVTKGRRFDADLQVVEIAKGAIASARVEYQPGNCRLINGISGDIVSNGGDFDATNCLPVGLLASDGAIISHQADAEPALGFTASNVPAIDHQIASWPNSVGLKRYLVVNGSISPNTSEAWNTREPRTIFGVKADGSLLILSVKGREDGQLGHDLYQAARTMIEFGAVTAADGDGGKSVQAKVANEIFTGTPSADPVADFVSIVIKTGGIPMAKYKVTVTWDSGASIRPEPSTSNQGVGVYPDNAVFYASELLADVDSPNDPTKQWAKVESDPVNGTRYAGKFVAVKYPASSGAVDRCVVEDATNPPPPPTASVIDHIEVVYKDGTRQNFVAQ